jgi:hypothetical protein
VSGPPSRSWALRRAAGVLLAGALERTGAPARPGEVPRSPEAIGVGWLTAALCAGVPGARVETVGAGSGSTGTTTRRALRLTYNSSGQAAGLPVHVFVKCTAEVGQRLMLGLGGLIHGEPGFYARIRPGLEIEAPAGYFGAVAGRSWRSVVVIEDVASTRGARFQSAGAPVGRAQAEDLVATAARWHGALWQSPALDACPWLRTPAEQMDLIEALIGLADRRPAGVARARAVIPRVLRERQADLFRALGRAMRLAGRPPHTYLHGDLHLANTYLTAAGRMGIADWQVGLRGCWAHDVAYLLATALTIEDRRSHERELLELYRERLAAAGGPELTREAAWLAYRQGLHYPYFAWIYTLGRARLQPRFQPDDVALALIERIAAAIADLDALGAVGLG